jgi:Tol biopolymer transport system component
VSTPALVTALLAAAATTAPLAAQPAQGGDSAARPLRQLPLTPTKPLRFTTDEGTWLSLDLSPDGKTLVFDLLGDLYTLPIAGGKATRITSGQALDAQPHWSPDGKKIVFVSDRAGSDNLWTADADGSNARALTREDNRTFISPTWTPDGKFVVVSRNGAPGGYNLFLYHRDGGGAGLPPSR